MKKVISAGGVVYRMEDAGLKIQLIEDRFGKMTLAKGKMEPGETVMQAALREIEEETGTVGRIVELLGIVEYEDLVHDSLKEVHYFLVEATGGDTRVQIEEISSVGWYTPEEAGRLQLHAGYENNNEILRLALCKLSKSAPKEEESI